MFLESITAVTIFRSFTYEMVLELICEFRNYVAFHTKMHLLLNWKAIKPYTPLSEQSKKKIHDSGIVEGFELCQLPHRIQCPHGMKDSVEGNFILSSRLLPCSCRRSTNLHLHNGANRRARHGRSEELEAYFFQPEKPINRRRRTSTHPFGKVSSMENIPWITRSS